MPSLKKIEKKGKNGVFSSFYSNWQLAEVAEVAEVAVTLLVLKFATACRYSSKARQNPLFKKTKSKYRQALNGRLGFMWNKWEKQTKRAL